MGDMRAATAAAERKRAAEIMRDVALAAGEAALTRRGGDAALDRIVAGLASAFRGAPIVSRELADAPPRGAAGVFFLVDSPPGGPASRDEDGAVLSMALVEAGAPRLGIVYAPTLGRLFWTPDPDFAVEERVEKSSGARRRLWTAPAESAALRVVVASDSRAEAADGYLARYPDARRERASVALAFCAVAGGSADLFAHLGDSMAWETAAGQAVLRASGGRTRALDADGAVGAPVRYRADAYANPPFVAYAPSARLR